MLAVEAMRDNSAHDDGGGVYTFANFEQDIEGDGKGGVSNKPRTDYDFKYFMAGTAIIVTVVVTIAFALSIAYAVYIKSAAPTGTTILPFYSNVTVYYASSLNDIMTRTINPAFQTTYNIRVNTVSDASGNLAKALKLGKPADVFISADNKISAALFPINLPGTTTPIISWYTFWASTNLGIGYNVNSTFAPIFESIANGSVPWYKGLKKDEMKIGRTDPDIDPKGERLKEHFFQSCLIQIIDL